VSGSDKNLTLVDLIDMLAEVPEPPPVSMLPQTGGWVVLGLLVVALLGWLMWRAVGRYRANAYRRAALEALASAGDDPTAISQILRRTALVVYPRDAVASLEGDAWLRFLDSTVAGDAFGAGVGKALADGPYRSSPPVAGLGALAKRWVHEHRVGKPP
jgi:hypothetical protein